MARPRYPKANEPRPPALPPSTRTVGQLVAETLRLYGSRFFAALPLGIALALADEISLDRSTTQQVIVLVAAAPFFTLSYTAACAMAFDVRPSARARVVALASGTIAFLPAALFFPWFSLLSVVWLALVGHVVPAAIRDGLGFVAVWRRTVEVARADFAHAVGGLATLVILFGLTRLVLGLLLREQADNTIRVSVFLSDVLLGPILFLGGALLYESLAARVGTTRADRLAARRAGHGAAK